jgi:hypothetical protein
VYGIDASDSTFATALRVLWDNSRIGKKTSNWHLAVIAVFYTADPCV